MMKGETALEPSAGTCRLPHSEYTAVLEHLAVNDGVNALEGRPAAAAAGGEYTWE